MSSNFTDRQSAQSIDALVINETFGGVAFFSGTLSERSAILDMKVGDVFFCDNRKKYQWDGHHWLNVSSSNLKKIISGEAYEVKEDCEVSMNGRLRVEGLLKVRGSLWQR